VKTNDKTTAKSAWFASVFLRQMWSQWFTQSARKGLTPFRCERQKNMKLATTAKLPKKTSAKVNDPDNPAWTEDMLGAPNLMRGRGPQATPTKVLTSVRLDADILEFFKSKGAGYQSRINAALRMEVERNLAGRAGATTRKRVAA